MHKPGQSELQLDRSRLLYLEHLGQISQEAAQPNIAKKAHHITSVLRKTLSNLEELAAYVMSKQTGLGNLANIPIQSQLDIQPSLKNQKPLNQILNLTTLNSITSMETDLQEKYRSLITKSLKHPTTSPLTIPTTNNASKHTSVAQDHT